MQHGGEGIPRRAVAFHQQTAFAVQSTIHHVRNSTSRSNILWFNALYMLIDL
jgi:hypothetical protein